MVTGIGFTMSLFIAGEAFDSASDFSAAKLAIFIASLHGWPARSAHLVAESGAADKPCEGTIGSPMTSFLWCILILIPHLPASPTELLNQAAPDSAVYHVSPGSRLVVKTGKSGLFGFAGHTHVIRARGVRGQLVYPAHMRHLSGSRSNREPGRRDPTGHS
jgi:hypothetical protein